MPNERHPLFQELEKALVSASRGDERSKFAAEEIEERLLELGFHDEDFGYELLRDLDSAKEAWKLERQGKENKRFHGGKV